jgi:hypothetical protein
MAKFIVCDFHGTDPFPRNHAVNIDLVQFIEVSATGSMIEFNFKGSERLVWQFENNDARNEEYERIINIANDED